MPFVLYKVVSEQHPVCAARDWMQNISDISKDQAEHPLHPTYILSQSQHQHWSPQQDSTIEKSIGRNSQNRDLNARELVQVRLLMWQNARGAILQPRSTRTDIAGGPCRHFGWF